MGEHADMLRATEAAVVSGVALREMNRAIDEHILPVGFFTVDGGRRHFSPGACVMMAFYSGSAGELTVERRQHVIGQAVERLRDSSWRGLRERARENWCLRDGFITVDLGPFVTCAAERRERLGVATELVTTSADVLGGTPVIRGTRVPVYDVAASVAAGYARERILDAYPSVTDEQVELAVLYASANPLRGRPRGPVALPIGTKVVESRVARRKKAG